MRRLSTLTLICLPLIPLISCSASNSKSPDAHVKLVDSGKAIDGASACTAAASYTPTFGSDQQAENFPASGSGSAAQAHQEFYLGAMNADMMPDLLDIELYAGYGGFGSGDIKNGTYTITGDDTKYSTCGICGVIWTNYHATGSDSAAATDYYMASGGSITLTSVTGTLAGSLSNVTFAHVSSMSETQGSDTFSVPSDTAVGDCNSTITGGTFSATLGAGSAAFAGVQSIPVVLHRRYR